MKSLIFFFYCLTYSFISFVFLVSIILVYWNKKTVVKKYYFFTVRWFKNLNLPKFSFWIIYEKIRTIDNFTLFYSIYMLSLNVFYVFFNNIFFFFRFSLNTKILDVDYMNYLFTYLFIDFFDFLKLIAIFFIHIYYDYSAVLFP